MLKEIYIYPLNSRDAKLGLYNPYIDDLINSVGKYYTFINKGKPSRTGIFDLIKYIGKVDYIYFNWIEKLPSNKGGKIQTLFLFLFISIFKILGVKIIWTMHNKLSHSGEYEKQTDQVFDLMLRKADYIITHSTEGIRFGCERVPGIEKKFIYFPHPVKDRRMDKEIAKSRDLLIWGTISPYKGIDSFLKFLHDKGLQNKFRLLIAGKSTSKSYLEQLKNYETEFIQVKNMFIEDDDLQKMIAQSSLVLFTYSKSSILSSGVLMDSLGYGANILGPSVGAFADLGNDGIIETFSDFEEIPDKIEICLKANKITQQKKLNDFLEGYTWEKFAIYFQNHLSEN